jgi:hypothetical protein
MIEQKGVRGFVKPGDVVLEVVCKNPKCRSPIPILNLADLPDAFELECPKCKQSHQYLKTEARHAKAHLKQ